MQHEILVRETRISNFMNCAPTGSFDQGKTRKHITQRNNKKRKKRNQELVFSSFLIIYTQRELSVIFLLKLFCFPFSESFTLGAAPSSHLKKNAALHIKKTKNINTFCFALPFVPTGQQTCMYVCLYICIYVLCVCAWRHVGWSYRPLLK